MRRLGLRDERLAHLEVVPAVHAVPIGPIALDAADQAHGLGGRGAPRRAHSGQDRRSRVPYAADAAVIVADRVVATWADEAHFRQLPAGDRGSLTVLLDLVSSVISSSFVTLVFSRTVPRSASSISTTASSRRRVPSLPDVAASCTARPRRSVAVSTSPSRRALSPSSIAPASSAWPP